MHARNRYLALALATILLCALAGCATTGKCGGRECPEDAAIRADVEARLNQHPELRPPNMVYVMVRDHSVTLSGQVSNEYAQRLAASVAREAPGVTKVVNLVALTYSGVR
jgi:osmotically-inducible protein OsmY